MTAALNNNNERNLESHRIKISGMSCSFCVETIRKAYKGMDGVQEVHVSLAHEEALIRYDPQKTHPDNLEKTLRQVGYTVRDPDKSKAFEEQDQEIRESKRKLKLAGIFTAVAAVLMIVLDRPRPGRLPAARPPAGDAAGRICHRILARVVHFKKSVFLDPPWYSQPACPAGVCGAGGSRRRSARADRPAF